MKYGDNKNKHMKSVAEVMYENAPALGLSKDEAYIVGLLHDVGYIRSKDKHEETGAEILKEMGFRDEYCDAIKYHGKNGFELQEQGVKITPMMMLLQFADMSVEHTGEKCGFDGRLVDISNRYGYGTKVYHNVLKEQDFLIKVFDLQHLNREEHIKPMTDVLFYEKVKEIYDKTHNEEKIGFISQMTQKTEVSFDDDVKNKDEISFDDFDKER